MTVKDRISKYNPELFDYTTGYDSESTIELAEGLSPWMANEAIRYYNLFSTPPSGLCGLAVLKGPIGNGKDLLGNYLSWLNYTAFPHKRLLRDEKPREIFGEYDGIFNDTVLSEDLEKMKALLKGNGKMTVTERDALLEKAADDWISSKGQVMLKNAILYLVEFWRYCYKRDPHNPMNKTMGGVHKVKRHLDVFILGTIQLLTDLDRFTALPFIDWVIECRKSAKNPTGFYYLVFKAEYQGEKRGLIKSPMPIDVIRLDGAKPITELGKPITVINELYHGNKQEQKVIDAIESGIVTIEDLKSEVKFRKIKGKAPNVSKIVKKLFILKVIDYGCLFNIYNSKAAVSI